MIFVADHGRAQVHAEAGIEQVQANVVRAAGGLRVGQCHDADARLRIEADKGAEATDAAVFPSKGARATDGDVPGERDVLGRRHAARPARFEHGDHGRGQRGGAIAEKSLEEDQQVVGGGPERAVGFQRSHVPTASLGRTRATRIC